MMKMKNPKLINKPNFGKNQKKEQKLTIPSLLELKANCSFLIANKNWKVLFFVSMNLNLFIIM